MADASYADNPLFSDLRTLTDPFQTVTGQGLIPVGNSWLTPKELATVIANPTSTVTGWLASHQTAVIVTAAALAALALIGGRRR